MAEQSEVGRLRDELIDKAHRYSMDRDAWVRASPREREELNLAWPIWDLRKALEAVADVLIEAVRAELRA